jgi:hypothetical protein
VPVRQDTGKLSPRGIEIEAGFAERGIIKPLGKGGEITEALLQRLV